MAKSTNSPKSAANKRNRKGSGGLSPQSASSNAGTPSQPGGKSQSAKTQAKNSGTEENSLTVDGSQYAPISIKKTVAKLESEGHFDNPQNKPEKCLSVFIDNTGNGFAADDPGIVNIMIADRVEQVKWFVDEIYSTLPRIPAYLYRYISWIMFENCARPMKYPSDNDFVMALASGILKQTDPDYQRIDSFIKWAKTNTEATHLIGLLQLVGGTLRGAAKKGTGVRMFIELPETGFHPKRERLLVSLLYKLKEDYGIKADWTEIDK